MKQLNGITYADTELAARKSAARGSVKDFMMTVIVIVILFSSQRVKVGRVFEK